MYTYEFLCKKQSSHLEKCFHEYEEKERVTNAEIQCLKEKLSIEEQEHQKQKKIFKVKKKIKITIGYIYL